MTEKAGVDGERAEPCKKINDENIQYCGFVGLRSGCEREGRLGRSEAEPRVLQEVTRRWPLMRIELEALQ